jgi:hypothetical protein
MTSYNSALKSKPMLASSLYGRGLVERQQGHPKAADADVRQARALDEHVPQWFTDVDITPRR